MAGREVLDEMTTLVEVEVVDGLVVVVVELDRVDMVSAAVGVRRII
jgi:hypothetical protein